MIDFDSQLDQVEVDMNQLPRVEIKTEHALALGFYLRKVLMPAGSLVSTKIHGVRSPFYVTKGSCVVRSEAGEETVTAPHMGITEPGTRRIIFVLEDTEWVTFQRIEDQALEKAVNSFESQLMIPHNGLVNYADALNRQGIALND